MATKDEHQDDPTEPHNPSEPLHRRLTPEQFHVTQEGGTERAFSGAYWDCHDDGMYHCVVCGAELFDSATKFDSGTGWPSFYETAQRNGVKRVIDRTHGMIRVEARCASCDAHLGHVFDDGPQPSGERFCMNSAALSLRGRDGQAPAPFELG